MKIKRIKKLKIGTTEFKINWINKFGGAGFDYNKREMYFCIKNRTDLEIWGYIMHEIMEAVYLLYRVRHDRPDVEDDYLFSFDHKQHDTISEAVAALTAEFLT